MLENSDGFLYRRRFLQRGCTTMSEEKVRFSGIKFSRLIISSIFNITVFRRTEGRSDLFDFLAIHRVRSIDVFCLVCASDSLATHGDLID